MNIDTITVEAKYCFGDVPLKLDALAKVNFIFAPNGSGKTTISSLLASQPTEPGLRATWHVAPTDLPIRVFNEAYRAKVLAEYVNGIFTMGQESQEVNAKIGELEKQKTSRISERDAWVQAIGSTDDGTKSGFKGELVDERNTVRSLVFDAHKRHPQPAIAIVFEGFRNAQEKFLTEALNRFSTVEQPLPGVTWASIESTAISLAGDKQSRVPLPLCGVTSLISAEDALELGSTVSIDVTGEFAALMQHLANQDWVSEGRAFLKDADGKCPFCQEQVPEGLEKTLTDHFAGEYDAALEKANVINQAFEAKAGTLRQELAAAETALTQDVDADGETISEAIGNVRTAITLLEAQIAERLKHPTQPQIVTDVEPQVTSLHSLIESHNTEVAKHNLLIANSKIEKAKAVNDGWSLFLTDPGIDAAIKKYNGVKKSKEDAIAANEAKVARSIEADAEDTKKIARLQESISNTSEVAERINKLLASMGFQRFKLAVDGGVAGGYRIVRSDGTTAFESLSEGEKSFLCFAYFWESLFGSSESGGAREDVIAVLDDPISSLDSDTLFMVAAYTRHAADLVARETSNLRQLIVLTHNTQFHHEAAYTTDTPSPSARRYFRLTKNVDGMTVAKDDNQRSMVRGSYPLLWDSVVEAANDTGESELIRVGVFNVVRRIVEGYFKIIGNVREYQRPPDLSPVEERVISTFHIWASSGSHTIADDIDQTVDGGGTKSFLKLFQRYFYLQGHSSHFDMMIKGSGGKELLNAGQLFAPIEQTQIESAA